MYAFPVLCYTALMDERTVRERYRRWMSLLQTRDHATKELLVQCLLEHFSLHPEHVRPFLEGFLKDVRRLRSPELARQYDETLSAVVEYFGVFDFKHKLDAACFPLSHPQEYREMQNMLKKYRRSAQGSVRRVCRILKETTKGTPCTIYGRFKEPMSIYRKLQAKQHRNLLGLNDIFGCRIVLHTDDESACFAVLHRLHDRFSPNPLGFKDYISIPKTNGYQSLHTVLRGVLPDLDMPVEVQIRTDFMDRVALEGFMAHWAHKQKRGSPTLSAHQTAFLQYISSLAALPLHRRHIYCLVNGTHLMRLPQESSLHDVLRQLHLQKHSWRMTVNGTDAMAYTPLQDGDEVELAVPYGMLPLSA